MAKYFTVLRIRAGKVENPDALRVLFQALKDGKYLIDINPHNQRSSPQNRYYHGICVNMVQKAINELGHDLSHDETHHWLKGKFNTVDQINPETGQVESIPLSTTRLNKEQFGEYIAKIQIFAAEFLNLVIPDPGQQMMIDL